MRGFSREAGRAEFGRNSGVVDDDVATLLRRCLACTGVEGEAAEDLIAASRPASIVPNDLLVPEAERWVRRARKAHTGSVLMRRRRPGFGWIALGVLVALLLAYVIPIITTGRAVDRELARLQAAHQLDLADFAPVVPEGAENAADIYRSCFPKDPLGLIAAGNRFLRQREKWTAPERERIEKAAADGQGYFAALERASRMKSCVPPRDWNTGAAMMMMDVLWMRFAGEGLQLRAEADLLHGEVEQAAAACAVLLRMAAQEEKAPTAMDVGLADRSRNNAVSELARMLVVSTPSSQTCRELADECLAVNPAPAWVRVRERDRALGWRVRKQVQEGKAGAGANPKESRNFYLYQLLWRSGWNRETLAYLRAMDDEARASAMPWPQARTLMASAEARLQAVWPYNAMPSVGRPWSLGLGYLYLQERTEAAAHAAAIGLLVAAYQKEHGQYPKSLGELEEKLPLDPYVQKPYHYRQERGGFAVWSVGPDMRDDGAYAGCTLRETRAKESCEDCRWSW